MTKPGQFLMSSPDQFLMSFDNGSPFQFIVQRRQSFRRRLLDLGERDHQVLHDMAAAGGTDYSYLSQNAAWCRRAGEA